MPTSLLLSCILLVGGILRFYHLGESSLWYDEILSVFHARLDLRDLLAANVLDPMPPFYALLLHWWLGMGTSEWMIRVPSAVFGIGALVVTYRLGATLFSTRVGLWAAALLGASPGHILYSQEARCYSLLVLLTLLSTYFLVRALFEQHRFCQWMYTCTAVLMLYTHYLAPLVIIVQAIFALSQLRRLPKSSRSHWSLLYVLIAMAWVPVLTQIVQLLVKLGSYRAYVKTGSFHFLNVPKLLAQFALGPYYPPTVALFLGLPAGLVLFIAGCGTAFTSFSKDTLDERYRQGVLLVFLWVALPTTIPAILWGAEGHYLIWFRYSLMSLPAFLLILALGLDAVRLGPVRHLFVAAFLLASGLAIEKNYRIPHMPDWRGLTRFVHHSGAPDDHVVFIDNADRFSFDYYYQLASEGHRLGSFVPGAAGQRRIWYVANARHPAEPADALERSLAGQYTKVEHPQFHWLKVTLYQRM